MDNTYYCEYILNNKKFELEVTGDILFHISIQEDGRKYFVLAEALNNIMEDSPLSDFYSNIKLLANNAMLTSFQIALKENDDITPIISLDSISTITFRYQKNQPGGRFGFKFEGLLEVS